MRRRGVLGLLRRGGAGGAGGGLAGRRGHGGELVLHIANRLALAPAVLLVKRLLDAIHLRDALGVGGVVLKELREHALLLRLVRRPRRVGGLLGLDDLRPRLERRALGPHDGLQFVARRVHRRSRIAGAVVAVVLGVRRKRCESKAESCNGDERAGVHRRTVSRAYGVRSAWSGWLTSRGRRVL